MKIDTLLTHFDLLLDAPNGVPKLCEAILQLAVQGRLTEQDPSDEPASALLERIEAEKQQLYEAGEIRKPKKFKSVSAEEVPFDLPLSWAWTRLGNIRHGCGQKTPDKPFSYIDVSSINKEQGFISDEYDVLEPAEAPSRARKMVRRGTVIYSTVRPYLLNIAIVDRDFDPEPIVSTAFTVMHPYEGVYNKYLYYYLRSQPLVEYVEAQMVGMAYPAISKTKLMPAPFPLPPLAEQRRIVARIDALMALCDRLEAQQAKRQTARVRTNTAALDALLEADAEDAPRRWAFVRDHFDTLYDAPENVARLRQAVLQLAVQGRLTRQDPGDEPASALLQRIEAEKQRLYEAGEIRKPKKVPDIAEAENPFHLSEGWVWTWLGDLCYDVADGPHFSPDYVSEENGVPFLSARNVKIDCFELDSVKYVSFEDHEEFCQRVKPEYGDILYTKGGTTGVARVNDLDFEFSVWVHLAVLKVAKEYLDPRYVALALNSPLCYKQSQAYTRGSSNSDLGLTRMVKIFLPLPPLKEQKRIVAKVDALMAHCDRLEAQLERSQEAAERLLEAVLHGAAEPEAVLEAA